MCRWAARSWYRARLRRLRDIRPPGRGVGQVLWMPVPLLNPNACPTWSCNRMLRSSWAPESVRTSAQSGYHPHSPWRPNIALPGDPDPQTGPCARGACAPWAVVASVLVPASLQVIAPAMCMVRTPCPDVATPAPVTDLAAASLAGSWLPQPCLGKTDTLAPWTVARAVGMARRQFHGASAVCERQAPTCCEQ